MTPCAFTQPAVPIAGMASAVAAAANISGISCDDIFPAVSSGTAFNTMPDSSPLVSIELPLRRLRVVTPLPNATERTDSPPAAAESTEALLPETSIVELLERSRNDTILVGGRMYANLDRPIALGRPLQKIITIFGEFYSDSCDRYSATDQIVSLASSVVFLFFIGVLTYQCLDVRLSLLHIAGFVMTGTGELLALAYFVVSTFSRLVKIANAAEEKLSHSPSRTGAAIWFKRLREAAWDYASGKSENMEAFRAKLAERSDVLSMESRAHYDYAAYLGPRSLRKFKNMAARFPRGVHILKELAGHTDGAKQVGDIEIDWGSSPKTSFKEEAAWLVQHGNRSVLKWMAENARTSPDYIGHLQDLVEHDAYAGSYEFVGPIRVNWKPEVLDRADIAEKVVWMVQRGNRAVTEWLADWARDGNEKAKEILVSLVTSQGRGVRVKTSKVRMENTHATETHSDEDVEVEVAADGGEVALESSR